MPSPKKCVSIKAGGSAARASLTNSEKRMAGRVLSMKTTVAFRSELELLYTEGALTKRGLVLLAFGIKSSKLPKNERKRRLRLLRRYTGLV